ncbi:hypothetical protein [Azospirillum sp. Sh1]|uniref:hypothetical protein n=1 Tax=Azospirillum sp. Sh1 TaxID=2607285 RepID=UPI0011EEC069|nr:hypothetical protein [Azospirillum sp. Sh1]KAA0576681.1 hypothetical protein FZ029_12505 [Azospirillum sp. Sh1]
MPTIVVTSPATDRRLCALDALKAELGIDAGDTLSDAWLEAEALSASDRVAEACRIAGDDAGDAPATFVAEVAVVTFGADETPNGNVLELPWRYPARVTAVAIGGEALDSAFYRGQPKSGLLSRLVSGGRAGGWEREEIAVTIASGWAVDKMPTVLQDAVKRLVRLRWEAKDRDLTVKAEQTEGAGRTEYWVGSMAASGSAMPPDVLDALYAAGLVGG